MTKPSIIPAPGYMLVEPYIEDSTFQPAKETDGLDQKSKVLKIGSPVIDSQGIERKAECKVGDIILHAYSNSEFDIAFTRYRFVHFTQVHGILKVKIRKVKNAAR